MAENDNEGPEHAELDAKLRDAVDRAQADPDRRRSISIRGTTYARLKAYCDANDVTMSSVVDGLIVGFIPKDETTPP